MAPVGGWAVIMIFVSNFAVMMCRLHDDRSHSSRKFGSYVKCIRGYIGLHAGLAGLHRAVISRAGGRRDSHIITVPALTRSEQFDHTRFGYFNILRNT